MEDLYLEGEVGDNIYFVTPLSHKMYRKANAHGMGGSEGYFLCSSLKSQPRAGFEVIAKTLNFEDARLLFEALTSSRR